MARHRSDPACERVVVPGDLARDWGALLDAAGFDPDGSDRLARRGIARVPDRGAERDAGRRGRRHTRRSGAGSASRSSSRDEPPRDVDPGDHESLFRSASPGDAQAWLGPRGWTVEVHTAVRARATRTAGSTCRSRVRARRGRLRRRAPRRHLRRRRTRRRPARRGAPRGAQSDAVSASARSAAGCEPPPPPACPTDAPVTCRSRRAARRPAGATSDDEPSRSRCGRMRSSHFGSHQLARAEQLHRRGHEQEPDDRRVDEHRGRHADAHHLHGRAAASMHEAEEHRDHDQRGRGDRRGPSWPRRSRRTRASRRCGGTPPGCARAGRPRSPSRARTGSRTSSAARTRRSGTASSSPMSDRPQPHWNTATITP